jgi:hypothetical protein
MNNTTTTTRTKRNLALAAVFMAATLLVGTVAATTTIATGEQSTAFAYSKKGADKKDGGGNDNGNTVTIEECKNKGFASGFDTTLDQECENLICTHPGNNATCVQEGAAVAAVQQGIQTTPVKSPCEQCFTKFLSSEQITALLQALNRAFGVNSLPDLCAQLSSGSSPELPFFVLVFLVSRLGETGAAQLIQCLKDAGIVFPTARG